MEGKGVEPLLTCAEPNTVLPFTCIKYEKVNRESPEVSYILKRLDCLCLENIKAKGKI